MKKLWILLLALPACRAESPPGSVDGPMRPVAVFAASSLREVVTECAGEWSRRTGRPARLQFEASSALARQIREGAPADVFVSADPEWLGVAGARERFDWLSNRLVCVVPREAEGIDLRDLGSLALAGEEVPLGRYARAALAGLGIEPPARILFGANARDVLAKVSRGGAAAGIVYATDAALDPGVRILHTFPPESHPRILYTAGLLTPQGREFYDSLREPRALAIAARHGFPPAD